MLLKKNQYPKYNIKKEKIYSLKHNHYYVVTIYFNLLTFSYNERYQEKFISGRTEVTLLQDEKGLFPKVIECGSIKYYAKWVFKPADHANAVKLAYRDLLIPCGENFDYLSIFNS